MLHFIDLSKFKYSRIRTLKMLKLRPWKEPNTPQLFEIKELFLHCMKEHQYLACAKHYVKYDLGKFYYWYLGLKLKRIDRFTKWLMNKYLTNNWDLFDKLQDEEKSNDKQKSFSQMIYEMYKTNPEKFIDS